MEPIVKMTLVSGFTSNNSRISLIKLILDRKKEMKENTPRAIPQTRGNSPGPGLEKDPRPIRIDSTQMAKDNPTRKRVLTESWSFKFSIQKM